MSKSTTVRTGTAALILVGALGLGPGLAAGNAAPAHTATAVTQSMTSQGTAWNYTGTWTDKQGRTGQALVSIVPEKFWKPGMMPFGMPVSRIASRSARSALNAARFGNTPG